MNRDTVTVGDPVTFRVRIRRQPEDRVELLSEGDFPGPFEVREQRPPGVRDLEDGRVEEVRDYVLAAYRVGAFEVPALLLRFRAAGGDTGSLASRPVPVVVRSVLGEGETDIRDVKPPVEMPARIPAWVWALAGLLALAAAALIWYLRRRKRRPAVPPPPAPADWPAEVEKIVRMGLVEKGAFKRYYTLLSEVARRYLEDRLEVEAMERTTFEVVRDLQATGLGEPEVGDLASFLAEADLVKFARFRPPKPAALQAAETVRALMGRIDAQRRARAAPDERAAGKVPAEAAP